MSLELLVLLIALGLGYSQIVGAVCNCTEQLQQVKDDMRKEMQRSISAVRKEIDALRNVTKSLPMVPDDIPISEEKCGTTDQLENMLDYIQQGIRNSSEDEFRQYNFTIQKLQSDLQNQVKRIQEEVIMHINFTGTYQNPANSCQQIAEHNPSSLPGYFWVDSSSPAFVYLLHSKHTLLY